MPQSTPTCPMPQQKVIDAYFMEHRAKLLDIAAFLDRIERAQASGNATAATNKPGEDFRITAYKDAIAILLDGQPQRARRILELLSDPTTEPIDAAGMKGASGAWPGR